MSEREVYLRAKAEEDARQAEFMRLQMSISTGWNIPKALVHGSEEWKQSVRDQVAKAQRDAAWATSFGGRRTEFGGRRTDWRSVWEAIKIGFTVWFGGFAVAGVVLLIGYGVFNSQSRPADPYQSRPDGVSRDDWDYTVGRFQQQGVTKSEAQQAAGAVADFYLADQQRRAKSARP